MWPLIKGEVTESPRKEIIISDNTLISGKYKLMTHSMQYAIWQGVQFPNKSTDYQRILFDSKIECSRSSPCLFDIYNDPSEHHDLSESLPIITEKMYERLQTLSDGFWSNNEIGNDSCPDSVDLNGLSCGCWIAINIYNSFVGPYQDLTEEQIETILYKQFGFQQKNVYIYYGLSIIAFLSIIIITKYCNICNSKKTTARNVTNEYSYGAIADFD